MRRDASEARENATDAGENKKNAAKSDGLISPGDTIAGRYVVEEVLGSGGMGTVVAARHEALGHRVAVKFVSGATSAHADTFVRFSREARIVASLESDHVVRVVDFGMHAGMPFMVMDLLVGRDLGAELKLRGTLPVSEAVDYVIQACSGLGAAHDKGVVHRDVKLANLFLATRADGERMIKVLDFGVSKPAETDDDVNLTRTATMIGSPLYMSPEQIRDPRLVDERADVWSLGIVLHKLLTGQAPFTGQSTNALCAAIAADPPARICAAKADLPAELEAVVLRTLEKSLAARTRNVAALARELAPFASAQGKLLAEQLARNTPPIEMHEATLSPVRSEEAHSAFEESAVATVLERQPRARTSRRTLALGAVAAIAVVAAVAGVLRRSPNTTESTRSEAASVDSSVAIAPEARAKASAAPSNPDPSASSLAAPAPDLVPAVTPAPTAIASTTTVALPPKRVAPRPIPHPTPAPASGSRFGGAALDDHH